MANHQCPECGNALADSARVCPHCGHDPSLEHMRETKRRSYWGVVILCGVMLIVVWAAIAGLRHG